MKRVDWVTVIVYLRAGGEYLEPRLKIALHWARQHVTTEKKNVRRSSARPSEILPADGRLCLLAEAQHTILYCCGGRYGAGAAHDESASWANTYDARLRTAAVMMQ